ncbi:hypothetical protein [Niallia circulans]|uniref:hypothetical protein n=1 Tax=Niallia circulans TaxID=1397 RepID=UPI001F29C7B7|nr:hypothetical protein [Niallia circulans]MCF2648762.1 hypothetical protein [Niallia circulans]
MMHGYPYRYQYPQQDSRVWFAAPFVGGLLGGVLGGALVRPRPFYCPVPYGPVPYGPVPYGPYPYY